MRWFEEVGAQWMRASDAIQIMRVHMDYVEAFDEGRATKVEDDWTEEDDEEFADLLKDIQAEESPEEGSGEEDSESDGPDETE